MSALESYGLLPAKRVRRCLEEANRYGVAASVLLTHDGSLLCSAGFDSLALPLEPHTVGAIAANVWGHYAAAGAQAGAGAARTMLCEVEGGMLGVCAACDSKYLIAVFAPSASDAGAAAMADGDPSPGGIEKAGAAAPNAGILAARLGALQAYFDEALRPLQAETDS